MKTMMILFLTGLLSACAQSGSGSGSAVAVNAPLAGNWTLQSLVCNGSNQVIIQETMNVKSESEYSLTYVLSTSCTLVISGTYTINGNTFEGNLTDFQKVGSCTGANPDLGPYQDTFTLEANTLKLQHINGTQDCTRTYTK